jgi:hypothetical protein
MAERSKALRSGRSLVLQAWVRIPLLTKRFCHCACLSFVDRTLHGVKWATNARLTFDQKIGSTVLRKLPVFQVLHSLARGTKWETGRQGNLVLKTVSAFN